MHAYPQQKEHLRPHKPERRTPSTSRAPTKPYNADAPRRYAPNESRPRKPPHSPTVEDVGFEFDEVQMRGKLDQTPMIITVGDESSSSDSSASLTPESSISDEQGDRFNRRTSNTKATKARSRNGPSAKAAGAKLRPPFQPLDSQEPSRGRRQGLTVDTETARSVSAGGEREPPVNYERARSPYSYRPRQGTQEEIHKPRPLKPVPASRAPLPQPPPRGIRGAGDYLLSPEALTPTVHTSRNGSGSSASYFQPQTASAHPHDSQPSFSRKRSEVTQDSPRRPTRPPIERRASALPQLGGGPPKPAQTASTARSRYVESSSDEDRKYAKIRSQSGQLTSEALPSNSSYFDTPPRPDRQYNSSLHSSPPRSPLSPEHTRGTFLNRDALLTGTGLQHLSSQLEGLHSTSRGVSPRASPLPSPRASPTHSPFVSPPRTPPEPPRHHQRSTNVESLKKDSPTSKPSSPLSSRPSSPIPGAQRFSVRPMENEAPPSPGLTKDRRTSTWDPATGGGRDSYSRPLADARAPPAAVPNHERVASYEKKDPPYRRDIHGSCNPTRGLGVSVEPAHGGSRQRSSSNASARGPPVLHQTTSDPSRAPDARPPSGPYVPAPAGAKLGSGLVDSDSSHRSRSTAPGSSHRHRSRSRTAPDVRTAQRSRSSAPVALVAASDAPTQPAFLPPCPRSEPVAGYDDWYELAINRSESNMDICPDCRNNIFGSGYERDFRRRDLPERGEKLVCGISDPWVRLACLEQFKKRKHDTTLLKYLAEVSKDYSPCPQGHLVEDRKWYHLRDNETDKDYDEFHICSHCLMSLEVLYPKMADMFHRSKDIERKKDPRVCDLRSDVVRFGQYLDHLGSMDRQLKETGREPNTSDFIWQVKLMTVITPCRGDAIHYGQDMHLHPDIPELTICEECYYKDVRPMVKKFSRTDPRHFALKISPEAKEKVGGTSCMLYSARMKQIFESACLDRDFESLDKAVKKRNGLLKDLEEAKMLYHKTPTDPSLKEDVDYLTDKWKKLARKHDRN